MADSSATIISRLGQRFNNATGGPGEDSGRTKPDLLTRDIGGHFRNNQPYISGYFHIMFGLPAKLVDDTEQASKWLHSTCEGFTPHTQTLNKVDIQGIGQIGSSYVASVTTTREFTTTFREYQNMPIMNVIRQWTSVFDTFTGLSPLKGSEFIPPNYKGWCAVLQTKPTRSDGTSFDISDVEECYIYQGVFPTNIPVDTASATDITGNDTVQLSVTWSFDGAPLTSAEPGVADKVISLFQGLNALTGGEDGSTYDKYLENGNKIDTWAPIPEESTSTKASY